MLIYKRNTLSIQNKRFLQSIGLKLKIFSINKNGNRLSRCYRKVSH